MSFLFATFAIPLWFLVFALACAAPLWISWYKKFYQKFIVTGILERKLRKAKKKAEEKVDVLKKATDYWDSNVVEKKKEEQQHKPPKIENTANQPYVKIVLKMLALKGDAGMLIQSIADELNIKNVDIKSSLSYLEENSFVDAVAGSYGTKYYLTQRGKNYCVKRGYIAR